MDAHGLPPPNPVWLVAVVFRSAGARERSHGSRANKDGEEGCTGHRGEVLCQTDLGFPEAWQRGVVGTKGPWKLNKIGQFSSIAIRVGGH